MSLIIGIVLIVVGGLWFGLFALTSGLTLTGNTDWEVFNLSWLGLVPAVIGALLIWWL